MDVFTLKLVAESERLLRSAGVEFCIRLEDGTIFGDLEPKEKAINTKINRWARDLGYREVLRGMVDGESKAIKNDRSPEQLENLRGAICGTAHEYFGAGNYRTLVDYEGNQVHIKRLAATAEIGELA